MKKFFNVHSRQSNSFVATAFGVVVTMLLVGGYEATHTVANSETADAPRAQAQTVAQRAQTPAVARMETIVVTARRG